MSLCQRVFPVFLIVFLFLAVNQAQALDPLPSWNEGPAKQAIFSFVKRVTRAGKDFVPEAERIAVFDNDGTLWSEQPLYFQVLFSLDLVQKKGRSHPKWQSNPVYEALQKKDLKALAEMDKKALLKLILEATTGMSTEEYEQEVKNWFQKARHPRFQRAYTDLTYQAMKELLAYLRSHGFKTFIVSGGGIAFMRPWTDQVYGIPPEQVVGSSVELKLEEQNKQPVLIREPKIHFIDDGPGKPVGIQRYIGRRPIAAFGNSDGDLQMLQWTAAGKGPRLIMLIHHDDAVREYAYDRNSKVGKLDKAWDEAQKKGWTIISMKKDWKRVFSFEGP